MKVDYSTSVFPVSKRRLKRGGGGRSYLGKRFNSSNTTPSSRRSKCDGNCRSETAKSPPSPSKDFLTCSIVRLEPFRQSLHGSWGSHTPTEYGIPKLCWRNLKSIWPSQWIRRLLHSWISQATGLCVHNKENRHPEDLCRSNTLKKKVFKRETYGLSKVEIFFLKVDLRFSFRHYLLDDEFNLLTTINTPYRRYRRSWLPFGLSVPENLQKHFNHVLGALKRVLNVADVIHAYGVGDSA